MEEKYTDVYEKQYSDYKDSNKMKHPFSREK
jgi:hypothetical protein